MAGRRWLLAILIGGAIALLIARGLADVYTDYLWYSALGAVDVWRAKFWSLLLLRLACAAAATLFVFANLYAVRQSVVSLVLPRRLGNIDIGEEVPREQLTYAAAAASLIIGVLLAWTRTDWSGFLAARIGKPFGEADPYFSEDLAFFVHRLPFELSLFNWGIATVLTVIAIVVLLYALTPSLRWEHGGLYVSGYVRRHLAMLAGALLLMLSWHYRLEMYAILGAGSGPEGAFTYFDHRVEIPTTLVMFVVTLGAGLTVLWAGWTGQMRLAFAALTGVIVAVLAARQVAPFIARRAVAERDPLARERPYEATRAGYTRRAFGVDRIAVADSTFGFASLTESAPFVSLWDDGTLRRRTDRPHAAAGVLWQVLDSALVGMVATSDGQGSAHSFLASAVDDEGGPVRLPRPVVLSEASVALSRAPVALSEAPVARSEAPVVLSEAKDLLRPRPLITVVADSTARPIVVVDSSGQVAAPALLNGLTRFAYALAMQDVRMWWTPPSASLSRLVERRSVRSRIASLAPFLTQGSTITPVWVADTLAWAVDMYSASHRYPLSRRIAAAGVERAYFQHAATAIVNGASGRVVFVADSAPDPVAATWMARFPRLFTRPTALRAGVREQLPPAIDGARAQAAAFGRYGTRTEADVVRHLPDDEGPDSALVDVAPPPLSFPRAGVAANVLPLLDRNERISGLFIAFGGPAHRTLWLRAREPAPLWNESLDRLRASDTTTAPTLVRGYVRVLPVARSIVMVQPRYDLRASGPARLLYVAIVSGDSVRTGRSVFQLAGRPAATPISNADFRTRVQELYDDMRRASTRGDWGRYGRAFDALGALLRQPRRP